MSFQGGVLLLLVALFTNVGFNTAAKKLSVDVGGAKRLHALSTVVSAILLLPWSLFVVVTETVKLQLSKRARHTKNTLYTLCSRLMLFSRC